MIAVKQTEEAAVQEVARPEQLANDIMVLVITVVVIASMLTGAGLLYKKLNDPKFWDGPVPPSEFIGR
jgi:hypothetical protein